MFAPFAGAQEEVVELEESTEEIPSDDSDSTETEIPKEEAAAAPASSGPAEPAAVHAPTSQVPSAPAAAGHSHAVSAPADQGAPASPRSSNVQSIGIDPSLPQFDDAYESSSQTSVRADGDWGFEFHGFLRAPMRMGVGPKNDGTDGIEEHSPPRVPDLSFVDWRYTHNIPGPWTQILLSYGNGLVKGTVGIAAFSQTNAGYRNLQGNLGINEAFLTLQFPDTFGKYGGLVWNVGAFSNRYGTAGKYNAGKYNTYLFGRTRVAGETLTAGINISKNVTLSLEHGVGAKQDIIPFETVNPRPEYLPYPGPVPQGTTWVHHAHASLGLFKKLTFGAHFLENRSPDDLQLPGAPSTPGKMTILGGEVRFDGDAFGHGYVGFSHINAKEILSLADSIEVLHSFAGWNFKNNYFGRYDPRTGTVAPDTSGQVDTVLFQYDLSVGALARYPTRFRGNGPDLKVSVFGMFNKVTSENNSHQKFKWGADALYKPFSVVGAGLRYDLVQPDLADRDQSFAVLSPKLVFMTQYISKEEVTLQYSRYFLGSKAYPAYPYEGIDEADPHVLMVVGRMWW